jgi:hypothetical protein
MEETGIEFHSIKVPALTRSHCDMAAFRTHKKFGGFANSDMFPAILARIRRDKFGGRDWFKLESPPEGVTIERGALLCVVSFDV